jgi:site-specific DNA recombinase
MTKSAIYARYSTDLQNARSIDDQVALCKIFADREGLTVAATFSDAARSGASVIGRDGLMAMMDAAREKKFNVLIVEALDRLSRDQEDLAGLYKRLTFLGIEIRAIHDGRADAVQIGVRGLLGQLYLTDLANKVRRGLSGRIREGRYAGGRPYGYRPKPGARGELVIEQNEAAIIRRIFLEYRTGVKPRAIADGLNRDHIPAPRGTFWNASTINGSRRRGTGILGNRLYAGEIVWNRVRMVKDPETGRRVSRLNPQEAWERVAVPHLAIVERDTFAAVTELRPQNHVPPWEARAPRHLLSGLLSCGSCGSGMAIHDRDRSGRRRVRCVRHREGGSCRHSRTYYLDTIERVVLAGLAENLCAPDLIAEYVKTYSEERRRLAAVESADRLKLERRFAEVVRKIERALDAICDGTVRKGEISGRLQQLAAEREALTAQLNTKAPPNVIALHPAALKRYLAAVADLSAGLKDKKGNLDQGLAEPLRELVEKVIVHPVPPRAPPDLEIRGYLAALTEAPLPPSARMRGLLMVAEEGFEPPTHGL